MVDAKLAIAKDISASIMGLMNVKPVITTMTVIIKKSTKGFICFNTPLLMQCWLYSYPYSCHSVCKKKQVHDGISVEKHTPPLETALMICDNQSTKQNSLKFSVSAAKIMQKVS